jgi:hypothetical protein
MFLGYAAAAGAVAPQVSAQGGDVRIGMIGLDTSHVTAFTAILNDPAHPNHVPGAKVTAGFKGGSPDMARSYDRIEGYTKELQEKWQVEVVDTIPALRGKVDAIMLTSVDGRTHLEQARPVIDAGLPLFVDKPLAASYADAKEIYRLANAKKGQSGTEPEITRPPPFSSAFSRAFRGAAGATTGRGGRGARGGGKKSRGRKVGDSLDLLSKPDHERKTPTQSTT